MKWGVANMTAGSAFVAELADRLTLDSSLWTEHRRAHVSTNALAGLPLDAHREVLAGLDYGAARVRAFVRRPPAVLALGSADEALACLEAGDSFLVDGLGDAIPEFSEIREAVAERFGIPAEVCDVKLSLSPPAAGLFPHFDQYDTIQLHLHGAKRWSISTKPATANPLDAFAVDTELSERLHGRVTAEELVPPPLSDITLRPGDVLTLPRGYWHCTAAEGPSTGLAIRLAPARWYEFLREDLQESTTQWPEWREPAYGAWGTGAVAESARARLQDLLASTFDGDDRVLDEGLLPVGLRAATAA